MASSHSPLGRSAFSISAAIQSTVNATSAVITACALTPANAGDGPAGIALLHDEEPGLQVLGDPAYGSGPVRAGLDDAEHTAVIKPWPLGTNPRVGDDQFARDDFDVDYDTPTVTCPNNETVPISASGRASFGSRCQDCPVRSRCTASANGTTFRVGDHDELLATARAEWRDGIGADDYRQHRPTVERSIAWLVRKGHRRVRYRGVAANQIGLAHRAAAINLQRLINLGVGLDLERPTWHFHTA